VRAPLSWLKDFTPLPTDPADPEAVKSLADTLDALGLVVEGVESVGPEWEGVVVARVTEVAPIAGADRIQRVVVDAGGGEAVEVVCGARNFAVGDLVPLARVGARLPGDLVIGERRVRGVTSRGMLCSPAELRLSEDHEGILVLGRGGDVEAAEVGDAAIGPGEELGRALGMERDVVFDLDVPASRPDASSMAGVARDVAARLGLPFRLPEPARIWEEAEAAGGAAEGELATVALEAPDLCPRLAAAVVTGVRVGPSPRWLAHRLTLAGMRPVNSVVDASNYVMLELGQPTHPYDLDRLGGQGLVVRAARPGETLVTLDGVERTLGEAAPGGAAARDCLICAATGEPVGIAGVMGGVATEISEATTRVLLESAYFEPMAVARTASRLGLRTEASTRFERGCDPDGIERAVARFLELLGARAEKADPDALAAPAHPDAPPAPVAARGLLDARGRLPEPATVALRTDRVNALLGTRLSDEEIYAYLRPLGFTVRVAGPGRAEVGVPGFRPDCRLEVDLVEEVARHHGYARIPRSLRRSPEVGGLTTRQRLRRRVRRVLVGVGADECRTGTLVAPDDHLRSGLGGPAVEVANPLTKEESVLRRTLLPGLLKVLAYNASRRGADVRLFEVGHVFDLPLEGDPLPREREHLAAALAWPADDARAAVGAWRALAGDLRLEGAGLEAASPPGLHPTRSARVVAPGGLLLGVVGEVHPEVAAAFGLPGRVGFLELDLDQVERAPTRTPLVRALSQFPPSDIDLAFAVEEGVAAGAIEATLVQAAGELLESIALFDVFRDARPGGVPRSLAWHLRFAALDHTLTDEEVAAVRARCIAAVEAAYPAKLRG
jgi:phenylalanyl-tRNA synthetase beta chain